MRQIFTDNFRLKILAVLLAISLEIYFVSPRNSVTTSFLAPIDIINVPAQMMIVSPVVGNEGIQAEVKVKGPRPLIDQLQGSPRRFSVSVPQDVVGGHTALLQPHQLRLPKGVEVTEITPSKLELRFERVLRKELYVDVDLAGEVAKGFVIDSKRVNPPTVVARGPEGELAGPSVISTEKIVVDGLTETKTFEVPLVERGVNTALAVNFVTVEIKVVPKEAERTIKDVKLKLNATNGEGVTIEPAKVTVVFSGPENVLDDLAKGQLSLPIEQELRSGRNEINLSGIVFRGAKILKTEPEKIVVNVVKGNG